MERIYLNEGWQFTENFTMELCETCLPEELKREIATVRIPHTVKETPFHYFDEQIYQMVSGYRRILYGKPEWKHKRLFLTFEGVAHQAVVYCNGMEAGIHYNGYTAFSVELTKYLELGKENVIAVKVDSRESLNIPPFGKVIDYMTYGGIYREVYLEVKEQTFLSDIFVKTQLEPDGHSARLIIENTIDTGNQAAELITDGYKLVHALREKDDKGLAATDMENTSGVQKKPGTRKGAVTQQEFIENEGGRQRELGTQKPASRAEFLVRDVQFWNTEQPKLYELYTKLMKYDVCVDEKVTVFGFRECEFQADGFYLNGVKTKLRGLNRHQSFPYVGYAMPASIQRHDADILKKELGLNAVRTSHYPQSQDFINRCDELGLLVFTEIPGWQHIGDAEWKAQAVRNVEEMILQYRNHPSIILWGVRINESQDDDEFYQQTNEKARKMDDTRATGGVRFLKKSHLLEDVYTYNDFSHTGENPGLEPKKKVTSNMEHGYLVSECNGHMYPAKPFDCEEHRLSHALRHANALEAARANEDIAGCFGWCMFDYNTHKDFGSGDRICYHGVMDMFRNPKLAAAVYASQSEAYPVFELSSSMDIGEHPGGNIGTVYAFTNADFIRVYKNEDKVGDFYPDRQKYGHLAHPPVKLDDFVGELLETKEHYDRKTAAQVKEVLFAIAKYGQYHMPLKYMAKAAKLMICKHFTFAEGFRLFSEYIGNWGGNVITYRLEAIKDGKLVKTITKSPGTRVILKAEADKYTLTEGTTYDCAAIRIHAVDEHDNLLYWYQEPLELTSEGEIELIGPAVISLKGGQGGCYVKTTGKGGSGKLHIRNPQTGEVTLEFEIIL